MNTLFYTDYWPEKLINITGSFYFILLLSKNSKIHFLLLNSSGLNLTRTRCYSVFRPQQLCQALTLKADSQPMKPQLRA